MPASEYQANLARLYINQIKIKFEIQKTLNKLARAIITHREIISIPQKRMGRAYCKI